MLAAAALSAGLTNVWNSDIHWHLAGGEWMLRNFRVLGHDPFSIDPEGQWVNAHWLFQVVAAALHAIGGFELLSFAKAATAVALVLILALALRHKVPAAWLILCALAVLIVAGDRIRVRPESVTLVFIMLAIVLLESVRLGAAPGRLWWLVPVMLVWVNMHGLFILGLGIIWSAMLGAWLDEKRGRPAGKLPTQQALAPLLAATGVCLVTPWPFQTVLHPLLLWTRVSGQEFYYTYGIQELKPTWQALGAHKEAVVVMALAVAAMVINRRAVPLVHALWLAAFVGIALLALRNISLVAPVCGFLLAWHGGAVIGRLGDRHPRLARAGPWPLAAVVVLAACMAAGYATELTYRVLGSGMRFGPGAMAGKYPADLAKWLTERKVDGDLFCSNIGDASVFEYYFSKGRDHPVRRVFMDGRLEAHSLQRLIEQINIRQQLLDAELAEKVDLPETVRFVFVPNDSTETLAALARSRRFRLVRIDVSGACFEDAKWLGRLPRSERVAQALAAVNIGDFDHPQDAGGLLRGADVPRRRWYRQNPPRLNFGIGLMLLSLGNEDWKSGLTRPSPLRQRCTLLAIRYLTAAAADGVVPLQTVRGWLAQAYQQRMAQCGYPLSRPLPADVYSARALRLYRLTDIGNLEDPDMLTFALMNVRCLLQSHQFDAADAAVKNIMASLPPPQRVNPPQGYLELRAKVTGELDRVETRLAARAAASSRAGQPPSLQMARELVALDVGLIDRAIAALRGIANPDAETLLFLGDLLLQRGQPDEAGNVYGRAAAALPQDQQWKMSLRQVLCDWVRGEKLPAAEAMSRLAETANQPMVRYYQALFYYDAGLYDKADAALKELAGLASASRQAAVKYHHALALQSFGGLDEAAAAFKSIRTDDDELKSLIDYAIERLAE
jgi:tetratricopeptide (TPR) repeat protein